MFFFKISKYNEINNIRTELNSCVVVCQNRLNIELCLYNIKKISCKILIYKFWKDEYKFSTIMRFDFLIS